MPHKRLLSILSTITLGCMVRKKEGRILYYGREFSGKGRFTKMLTVPICSSNAPFSQVISYLGQKVDGGQNGDACMLSHVQLCATPWTVARQAPLSIEFSRQEHRNELPFPPPGDHPSPGIKPASPVLQVDFLPTEPLGKPRMQRLQPLKEWVKMLHANSEASVASIKRFDLRETNYFILFHDCTASFLSVVTKIVSSVFTPVNSAATNIFVLIALAF